MGYQLGISAFYHDSATALIKDGEILCAIQEERLTRIKNDHSFPHKGIEYILDTFGLEVSDFEAIVFYDKPFLKFERILESSILFTPGGVPNFVDSMEAWLGGKMNFKKFLLKEFKKLPACEGIKLSDLPLKFSNHHLSHAASVMFTSPFKEAAILTIDGVGEWATCSISTYRDGVMTTLKEMHYPHSVGLLYSAFTYYCGFKVNSGEYKLMGLSPYGNPNSEQLLHYIKLIKENIVSINQDGSIEINLDFFSYHQKRIMIKKSKFESLFGLKVRKDEEPINQKYCDMALAIQKVTEEIILKLARHTKEVTGLNNLCLSGGVALNCVANGKLERANIFEKIFIHPACGDAGGALGAVLAYWYSDHAYSPDPLFNPYLGPIFSCKEIIKELNYYNLSFSKLNNEEVCKKTAELLQSQKIVGWFQGKMEWGPRALGNRSIIASPIEQDMQTKLNLKIKYRESFRPFAPIVLKEKAGDYFEHCIEAPYMLRTFQVKDEHKVAFEDHYEDDLMVRLKKPRSKVNAITHLDYSARVQTVDKNLNPKLHQLLSQLESLSHIPVLINTSFNVRGEPIVCSPKDAIECFLSTEMDVLVLGNYLIEKEGQSNIRKDRLRKRDFKAD